MPLRSICLLIIVGFLLLPSVSLADGPILNEIEKNSVPSIFASSQIGGQVLEAELTSAEKISSVPVTKERSLAAMSSGNKSATLGSISAKDLNSGLTPSQLVEAIIGEGVAYKNVTYTGSNGSSGIMSSGKEAIGFDSGVVLSSGYIAGNISCLPPPNKSNGWTGNLYTNGDTDLNNLIPGYTTRDASVLEFDFKPVSSVISFNYVFGSEEYNEFVHSSFNDVFGFFVNGENIARIPGTLNAVSINNVNNGMPFGSDNKKNSDYYRNNALPEGGGAIPTELDGLTRILTATAHVNANKWNHIKLAVADAGDGRLDSAVFIQTDSFESVNLILEPLSQELALGKSAKFVATLTDNKGTPKPNVYVNLSVISGPNTGLKFLNIKTNSTGGVSGSYIGMKVGTDLVEASGQGITSNLASVKWNQTLDNITPVIISATPNTGAPGKTIPYNITGLNFNGSIVSLTRSGQKDLIGNNTVTSSTMLLGNLTIRPDAPIGAWSWQVTNQNGKKSNQINFTVNSGPWEITSVSPSFACRGSTFPFTITGKIFDNPKKVILSKEYCGVPLTSDVKTWTSTSITGSFSIPASACVGDWYFYVTDNSGTNRCQINYPIKDCSTKPSVSAIYPVEGARNKLIPFLITGSGFLSGNMTVQLTKTGSSSISATNLTIDTTSQQIFGSFLIPKTAKTGSYRVSVNAGSLYSTQKVYFTVF